MHKIIILEVNADIDIARVTINKGYFTLMHSMAIYTTHSSCMPCLMLIHQVKILTSTVLK